MSSVVDPNRSCPIRMFNEATSAPLVRNLSENKLACYLVNGKNSNHYYTLLLGVALDSHWWVWTFCSLQSSAQKKDGSFNSPHKRSADINGSDEGKVGVYLFNEERDVEVIASLSMRALIKETLLFVSPFCRKRRCYTQWSCRKSLCTRKATVCAQPSSFGLFA